MPRGQASGSSVIRARRRICTGTRISPPNPHILGEEEESRRNSGFRDFPAIAQKRALRGPFHARTWSAHSPTNSGSLHPIQALIARPEHKYAHQLSYDTGPGIGVPSLRVAFPHLPPCELTDLRHDYWQVYRHHNHVVLAELTWNFPGRVWAIDHANPPGAIDGVYAAVLAVRDLASGTVLDWLPVPDETAATTRDALLALFVEFGPPLVLKSDNGSAFKADVLTLLDDWQVTPLPSPAWTPSYNGSCEAGIGGLKTRTFYQAAQAGHPGIWTSEDTEAARRQANEFHYPHHHRHSTALAVWQSRSPITTAERERFLLTVRRLRSQIHEAMDLASQESLTAADHAAIHRRVVRQALVELGILSITWRSISLPIKPRKCARIS